jgi:hypothetical protein
MATVATVYTLAPQVRTAEAILGREDEPGAERPRAQNKRVWASLERDSGRQPLYSVIVALERPWGNQVSRMLCGTESL